MSKPFKYRIATAVGVSAMLVAVLALSSCNFAIDDIEAPTWEPDILAPVARSTMQVEDLDQLAKVEYHEYIGASGFGLPTVDLARSMRVDLGPFPVEWFEGVVDMEAYAAELKFKFKNDMPVDFSENSRIRLANAGSGETVIELLIDQPIPAFSKIADSTTYLDVYAESGLEIWLEDLELTPVVPGPIDDNLGMQVDVELRFVQIEQVRVKSGSSMAFSDTSEFDMDLHDTEDLGIDGELRLQLANGLPFGGHLDLLSMDAGKNITERLTVEPAEIPVPPIGKDGTATAAIGTEIVIPVNDEKLDAIREAAFVAWEASIFSPSSPDIVTAGGDQQVDLKLIADVKFRIQP